MHLTVRKQSNFPNPMIDAGDAGRAWLLDKRAMSFKIYSRRPMLNKLMTTVNSGLASPHALSSIHFKHKNLGVNASAYNYSFAADRTQHIDGELSATNRSLNRNSSNKASRQQLQLSAYQHSNISFKGRKRP